MRIRSAPVSKLRSDVPWDLLKVGQSVVVEGRPNASVRVSASHYGKQLGRTFRTKIMGKSKTLVVRDR